MLNVLNINKNKVKEKLKKAIYYYSSWRSTDKTKFMMASSISDD